MHRIRQKFIATARLLGLLGLLLPLTAAALAGAAHAQEVPVVVVEGQRFAARLSLAGSELQLNGTGVRAAGWFKGYAAGLYLRERADTAEQAQAQPLPKRVQLRMLNEVPATELSKAVYKGVNRNLGASFSPDAPEAARKALAQQLARVVSDINAVEKVRKGDVVDIDQDPSDTLRISVNGTLRSSSPQARVLFSALLQAFIGQQPYDERLKAGLLGRSR